MTGEYSGSPYSDFWEGGLLFYVGAGRRGDQKLTSRNKALWECLTRTSTKYDKVEVILRKQKGMYQYKGSGTLGGELTSSRQPDDDGKIRDVLIFPIQTEIGSSLVREIGLTYGAELSDRLYEMANSAKEFPRKSEAGSGGYLRNVHVMRYTLLRANGKCELCAKTAPFENKNGEPYLECHHIVWLSHGGSDLVENTAALCPNCHRKIHVLNSSLDTNKLLELRNA